MLTSLSQKLFYLSQHTNQLRVVTNCKTNSIPTLRNFVRFAFCISAVHRCFASTVKMASQIPTIQSINNGVSYVTSDMAKLIDVKLMTSSGFSIDQLMELAGYSVACAALDFHNRDGNTQPSKDVLIFCGPGNNGGDGLVAARHLSHFGFQPTVVYPKHGKGQLFANLIQQCRDLDIPILESTESSDYGSFGLIVDAMFGFSFDGPPREPYAVIIRSLAATQTTVPVISVDIPSGWDVEKGDVHRTGFVPAAVVSLTVPKLCLEGFAGTHYVGGRFVPPRLATELELHLPDYGPGPSQIVKLPPALVAAGAQLSDNAAATCSSTSVDSYCGDKVSTMFVTASSQDEARSIARSLVELRLAACVNMLPGVESVYEWEGQVEVGQEILLVIKTQKAHIDAVTSAIRAQHSYKVFESIAVDVVGGSAEYLDWVRAQTTNTTRK